MHHASAAIAPVTAAHSRVPSRSGKARLAAAAAACAATLFVAGCGFVGGEDAEEGLGAGDYTVAAATGVIDSVVVNGNIAPIRSMSITSPLQSKVESLAVSVGDRVEAGQFLAEMDTEALERELANQREQQAAAQAEAAQSYQQAQAQLSAHTQQVRGGTHPAISAAEAQLAQAEQVAQAEQAAKAEYTQEETVPARMVPVTEEYSRTVEADSGSVEAAASQLQSAKMQAAQENQQLQAQAESAYQQAQMAGSGSGAEGSLEYQVQQSTIYAPIPGVVSSVDVQEGDVPQGRILSIADDSRLLIRSEVRESDVPLIQPGDRVTFTSTATGEKQYAGKVGRIAPVGSPGTPENPQEAMDGGGKQPSASVTFPIEIEVEGDKEGLLLGGTVRAEIITEEAPGALAVPRDAVFDAAGDKGKVLVLTAGEDGREGIVEERSVTTGASNDVDIAVTGGGLKPGDIVINWPDDYRGRVGETLAIDDPKFDPAQVDAARAGEPGEPGEQGK